MYAVKLIKRVAIQSCQAVDAKFILKVFDEHKLWNQYHNPYLTIDYPKKRKMNDFCRGLFGICIMVRICH